VTSYAYQLNGGAWVNVGDVLATGLTGLTAGTSYTIAVHALDAAGNIGPAATVTFSTPLIIDSSVMTEGAVTSGSGFEAGITGSMSVTKTSNGYAYKTFFDNYVPGAHGSGRYTGATFAVSGFATDPGIAWLSSAAAAGVSFTEATATYAYSAGTATWNWAATVHPGGVFYPGTGTAACTITHK